MTAADKLVFITVGRNQDGRLEVFGVGRDKSLWHNWQTAPNNGWSGWQHFMSHSPRITPGR